MGIARFKAYDWGVVALFVLIIIGVSLSWYTISLSVAEEDLGSVGVSGWDFSLGVMSFVFALIALGWVGLKAVIAPPRPVPFLVSGGGRSHGHRFLDRCVRAHPHP